MVFSSDKAVKEKTMQSEASSNSTIVQTVDVTRVYRMGASEVHALRGISLDVPKGQFVAVMGRSGSGKTTLLNCIGGLDRPTSGEVYIKGQKISDLSDAQLTRLRRHSIGFVFQSYALMPTFTAYENVELPLRIIGAPRRQRVHRTRECLEMVGLTRWARHRSPELSGGQQQRVAIARALAIQPEIILADEPTGELDSGTGWQILELFARIVEEENVTVIMVSHDPTVEQFAARIYHLEDGQISEVIDAGPHVAW
jgi:ABC-type lipoprotein export system ATPase subunit